MNKTELIAIVSECTGITKKDTEQVLNAALISISRSLSQGEKIQLSGFGTFEVRQRKERICGNPRNTGESIHVAATKAAVFKPCKALKESVAKK